MKKLLAILAAGLLCGCAAAVNKSSYNASPDQRRWLWCDGEANVELLDTDSGVSSIVEKAAKAGITDLVVDVKLISGEVLYNSKIAPHVTEWNGKKIPGGGHYDRLAAFVKTAHAKGLRVHASMNTFSEAHKQTSPMRGNLLKHRDWQTMLYTRHGIKPTLDVDQGAGGYAGFTNPILPQVQAYELSIIKELASGYAMDGIVFDRLRYDGMGSDFSDYTRAEFEKALGAKVENWPQDIFTYREGDKGIVPGKLFNRWIEWRAGNIKAFLEKAAATARAANPKLEVNAYAGSWYPLYYDVGVNWGSTSFKPGYKWMTPDYSRTGYVGLIDHLMTGCYYPSVTVKELEAKKETYMDPLTGEQTPKPYWFSVEGACAMAKEAVNGEKPVYGSLYVYDYFNESGKNPEGFKRAIRTCMDNSNGVMLFDLVYIEKHDLWGLLAEAFRK